MEPTGEPLASKADQFLIAFSDNFKRLIKSVDFGAAVDCFDKTCWKRLTPKSDTLVLCAGTPSDGIDRLLDYAEKRDGQDELEKAALDCVELIEVCRWLAERDVIGVAAFNHKYGSGPFKLAAPGSTGVISSALACRGKGSGGDNGDDEYYEAGGPLSGTMVITVVGRKKRYEVDLAECLHGLRIGSRVMWRNFDKKVYADDDFKNENTVKIGDNLYAAHPLGIFSLEEMGLKFAAIHYEYALERIKQTKDDLESDQRELLALKSVLEAHGEGDRVTGMVKVSGKIASIVRDDLIIADAEVDAELDAEMIYQAINKRFRQIKNCQKTLEYYDGIKNLEDYIARFIRVVEAETFVNPCATF